tara:strand:- start:109 stop:711 length:603 start_codon:yes stop_codon:yes gene_type:complete
MGKATIILVTLAALGLGTLIGASFVEHDETAVEAPAPAANTTVAAVVVDNGGAPVFRYLSPDNVTVEMDQFGSPLPSAVGENYVARERPWKSETLTIDLQGDAAIEYKVVMEQGDAIVFNWRVDEGQAYYDFHAHDASFGEEFFTRYEEGESGEQSGAIVAPYDGQHGWYWLNIEAEPIKITLEVAGFYDEIVRIDLEGY